MKITITRAAFDTALHIEGKSFWLSQQLKAVQLALTNYALDRDNPALEPAARNNLNFAIYTWKQQKPTEFEKYDNVGGGVVRKLAVQTGLDDYRPAPSASVLLRGTLRVAPTERAEPVVTPLSSDLASLLVEYAAGGRKVAVLVIDLYGADFDAQGMNARYDGPRQPSRTTSSTCWRTPAPTSAEDASKTCPSISAARQQRPREASWSATLKTPSPVATAS